MSDKSIWVFHGEGRFAGGAFTSRELAEAWIARHSLSGVLTLYPLDTGVYEWAVARGTYDGEKEVSPRLVGSFSSAYQEHYHYVDGSQA
jgi:hypothetical protein